LKLAILWIPSLGKKALLFLASVISLFTACGPHEEWNKSTLVYFDTICEMNVLCEPRRFEACQKEVQRIFAEIETSFSPGIKEHSSPLVLNLFDKALQVYQDSNGFFDITVAPLSRLWGFIDKKYHLPAPEGIEKTLKIVGMDKVKKEKGRLVLLPDMELDWGGIAKGLGIDLASGALKKMGISRAFINSGGDLFCWGSNPSNRLWKIGIMHPRKNGYLGVLSLSDMGIATTGDYQRYFEIDNVRYHHVLDPHTGYPSRNKQSVTVIGPQALYCDALSTALFASPHPEKIMEKYPEYGALIVDSKGNVFAVGKSFPVELL
jgi:thiamine biosynthesis lipoprotein